MNKITGEYQRLTSWKNSEDPFPGLFSEGMDLDGSNQYVLYRNLTKIFWYSGLWNGFYFEGLPTTTQKSIFNFSFVDEKDRKYSTYTVARDDIITRGVMGTSGQLVQYIWFEGSQQWQTVSAFPARHCDVYQLCGPFGVCEEKRTSVCQCSFGFQPASGRDWKLNDWSKGCVRSSQLQCAGDWFYKMDNMRLPDDPYWNLTVGGILDCEGSCRNDCSCNAYAYDDNKGCSLWKVELQNIHQLYDGDTGGAALFLRLSARDMPPGPISSQSSHKTNNYISLILGLVLSSVILIMLLLIGLARVYQNKKRARLFKKADGSLIRFHYKELQHMTKNFKVKLGSGGFGTVYKGEMPGSTSIAIKTLEGLRQGEKQFRAEVSTLGTIQHVNLVRLVGFCFEGSNNKKLLVYELMPKGSLDAHLFKGTSVLNWSTRYQIALGTARGLTYLHEQCRERIIHCDIKPDNILLDESFIPKVADFGLAKLYDRDFSKVLTSMRGTIGYLAPEWISGSEITPKVDVYSYGMMLFEIISGKRNRENNDVEDESYYYPSWAAKQIRKGDVMSILDARLNGVANIEQVSRVGKVAIWCVQDMEERRPTMGQIVHILEGLLEVNMPPISHTLQINDQEEEKKIDGISVDW